MYGNYPDPYAHDGFANDDALWRYLKEWIEDSINDQEVLNRFKAEYGTIQGMCLRHVKRSFDMANQTSMVYGKLEHANSLAEHFGPDYANVTVSPGPSVVYVSALNQTSSPDEYDEIKINVGPFVVPAPIKWGEM